MRVNLGLLLPLVDKYAAPTWAILISGFFMLLSVSLSMYLIFQHLSAYNNPEEQKFVLGVILMVPCYAIESYVSLVNPDTSVYCGILRDGYEAFAMYCFGRYITACLGGEEKTIAFLKREGGEDSGEPLLHRASEKGVIHHHFPINYILKPWRLGVRFYQIIKFGIFQYVIIKTLTASLSLILQPFGIYCEGEFKWGCGYPYFAVVLNFSQYWALYCLVEWYTATKDELAHIKPLAKFLSFKSIVFLTWWQGVIIAIMYSLGLVRSPLAQSLELKSSIQDFIICIEMGIASVVHLYVFPAKPYELLGKQYSPTDISVLGDYAASDPVDPDEIKDISRPTKVRLPQLEPDEIIATNIKESVQDFVVGSGKYVIKDFKFTVKQAVRPVEKRFDKMKKNIKFRQSQDDNWVSASPPERTIRGIDDPLISGSASDSGVVKGKRHRTDPSSGGTVDSWEGTEQAPDGFVIRGRRWEIKKL
ncbi:protein LAZ1-like [Panicum miliaceum]|uniref:Protein LAZ1-like n=1 Tax=Panicum miliaceum TaxID=4540 RepID=A0A3L6RN65_PANMI|nr:protein LAZ1-like [Panicum miliaceum]